MPTRIVKLIIEGLPGEKFRIRLADFLRELNLFLQLLNEADHQVTSKFDLANDYRIIDLSHSSPATVVVEAVPRNPRIDISDEIITELFGILGNIDEGKSLPKRIGTTLLTSIRDMSSLVGPSLSRVQINSDDKIINMGPSFSGHITELLRREETFPGAIRGMLESINIHLGVNVFRIYPDVGPQKVACHFPNELQTAAVSGIGKFVEVRGILKYKAASPYPYQINVEDLVVFPSDSELPRFSELLGVAPNATGEVNSETFIRRLRDASA